MIRAIRSDKPEFKTVTLQPGFNVIIAERTQESTVRDSRNGLGKTTLIEIINFCLGGGTAKGKGLRQEPLVGWTFSMELDLRGQTYAVHRNTAFPGRVIVEGDCSDWPIKPATDKKTGEDTLSISDWNNLLGWLIFDLPLTTKSEKYTPSFRSLISYFVRSGRDAFSSPFEHYRKQLEWDIQVNNAFLLGLGWEYAQRWQILKDRDKALQQLREAVKSGLVSKLTGTVGELETRKVRLEDQVRQEERQLLNFRVHPQYRQIETRASQLTGLLHQLSNDNIASRRMLEFYEESLADEQPARTNLVVEMYNEAGVSLSEQIVRRLEDVQEFHSRVVENRRRFLEGELARLRSQITDRERNIETLTEERASLMVILQTQGALEEYTRLQQRYLGLVSQLEEVKLRIEDLQRYQRERSALKIEQEQLSLDARLDYEERKTIRQRAISLFNANTESLYQAPGRLVIDIGPTGYKFSVDIERSMSQGVEQMKVFCYDLTLAQLWSEKPYGPGFLVHDSTIFDGVDERQIALGLQLAARQAKDKDFQYICALNSDLVPWTDFSEGFDLLNYVRLTLTDAREDGGLLGIRF